jgi:uncharacterized protein (DUF1330 family)
MAKAYWITFYRSIRNPDALAAYARLARPAIEAAGASSCAARPRRRTKPGSASAPW